MRIDASALNRVLQKRAVSGVTSAPDRSIAHSSPTSSCYRDAGRESAHEHAASVHPLPLHSLPTHALSSPLQRPHPVHAEQTQSINAVLPTLSSDEEIAAHREKHARFFTMLRVGIARETVEHAMRLAGIDPVELDGPHLVVEAAANTGSVNVDPRDALRPASPTDVATSVRKKALRKRLYWDVKVHKSPDNNNSNSIAPSRDCMWRLSDSHADASAATTVSHESEALLEMLFVKEAIAPVGASTSSGNRIGVTTKPRVAILDPKKAQNIGIAIARVKLSLPQLVRELVGMNPTVLCAAQLQGLLDMWPDRKELEAIDDCSGDTTLLGKAEQFFVEIKRIPRFREKLECLIFKQEFPSRVHELRESIRLVVRAIHQVCSSCALRQVFRVVLHVGNALNFGADSAHATRIVGFSLSSLSKLAQTKAFAGGITLLQFVVHVVNRDCPHVATFHREIGLVAKCSRVSIQGLLAERQALEAGWKALVHEAHASAAPASDDGNTDESLIASSILTHFAAEVESELEAIESLLQRMMESKQRFLEYFDEEDAADELDVLLQHIAQFADEFQRQHTRAAETAAAIDRAIAKPASTTAAT